jgi:carboxylesterase family protein
MFWTPAASAPIDLCASKFVQTPRRRLGLSAAIGAMRLPAAAAAGLLLLSGGTTVAAPVQVQGGAIVGAPGADGTVSHYLGVPFAAPPVAGLRWRPPQPVAPWQGVLETTDFAPPARCRRRTPSTRRNSFARPNDRARTAFTSTSGRRRGGLKKSCRSWSDSTAAGSFRGRARCRASSAKRWRAGA